MKKLATLFLSFTLILGLVGCTSMTKDTQTNNTEITEEVTSNLDTDLNTLFTKACENSKKEGLTPLVCLGTQVVSGTNYKFLCSMKDGYKIATLYEDLDRNVEITDVVDFNLNGLKDDTNENTGGWQNYENKETNVPDSLKDVFENDLDFYGLKYICDLGTKEEDGKTSYSALCQDKENGNIAVLVMSESDDGMAYDSALYTLDIGKY